MNIRQQLLKEHSKKQSLKIAAFIGDDKNHFAQLMGLFLNDDYRVVQRSALVVSYCSNQYPHLITPWLKKIVSNLKKDKLPDAVKRNSLRILQFVAIPKGLQGSLVDYCFIVLATPTEPIAVRVFAMTILFNISKSQPDITNELKLLIEINLPYSSAGFKSRGNKILRQINALNN